MLTINLPPEVENQVLRNAAERGINTEIYLHSLILEALQLPLPPVVQSPLTPQEQAEAFRRWAADPPHATGPYPETAFRREDIYDDDGR